LDIEARESNRALKTAFDASSFGDARPKATCRRNRCLERDFFVPTSPPLKFVGGVAAGNRRTESGATAQALLHRSTCSEGRRAQPVESALHEMTCSRLKNTDALVGGWLT